MKSKHLKNEIESFSNKIKNLEIENINVKSKLEERNEELKTLMNEKLNLTRDLGNRDLDFECFKNEIKILIPELVEGFAQTEKALINKEQLTSLNKS
jgi:hypothetical protein